MKPRCMLCGNKIKPKEPRMKWWTTDKRGNTMKRGFVHLECVMEVNHG